MIISVIGMLIGALVAGVGVYYLMKEKQDKESVKIYGIISGIGGVIFIGLLVKLIYDEFGVRPIALGVHKDNIGAEHFYLNHGFRKTAVMEGNDYYYLRYPNENTI